MLLKFDFFFFHLIPNNIGIQKYIYDIVQPNWTKQFFSFSW